MNKVILAGLCLLVLALGSGRALAKPGGSYRTEGECAGFPKVGLQTSAGTCVGLVAEHLGFVRGTAVIEHDIFVADMGGWHKGHGRILRLAQDGRAPPQTLLDRLDEPNAVAIGPAGTLYVGVLGRIFAFDPMAVDKKASMRDIVTNLPDTGRHPLPAIVVAKDGSLFVNVGSATDHCERQDDQAPDKSASCPETLGQPARGSILHVMPGTTPIDARTLVPYATGLRNSMALALAENGQLMAAVNARDDIDKADPALSDKELPHDTFDDVVQGKDYGWPYCFDMNRPSPEYPDYDCGSKQPPTLLLPPHAAPLGMIVYHGDTLPGLNGQLLIGYHGYREKGHRIVALGISADGAPQGSPRDVVSGWDAVSDDHPQGAPVALLEMTDGSVLITEDHNGTLLRLARDRAN